MNNNQNYGIITEQGDLGLGFEQITEQEQETLKKKKKKDEEDQ